MYNVTLYLNSTVLHFQLGRAGAGARGPRRSVRQRGDIQDLQAGITHPHHRRHHCQPPSKSIITGVIGRDNSLTCLCVFARYCSADFGPRLPCKIIINNAEIRKGKLNYCLWLSDTLLGI